MRPSIKDFVISLSRELPKCRIRLFGSLLKDEVGYNVRVCSPCYELQLQVCESAQKHSSAFLLVQCTSYEKLKHEIWQELVTTTFLQIILTRIV